MADTVDFADPSHESVLCKIRAWQAQQLMSRETFREVFVWQGSQGDMPAGCTVQSREAPGDTLLFLPDLPVAVHRKNSSGPPFCGGHDAGVCTRRLYTVATVETGAADRNESPPTRGGGRREGAFVVKLRGEGLPEEGVRVGVGAQPHPGVLPSCRSCVIPSCPLQV